MKKSIDEIVKIIKDFQCNDELSQKYKREVLDQEEINLYNYCIININSKQDVEKG